MSLPEFPTVTPPITREDALNQIISSIAMEELALSHIINAEGEKLQYILGTIEGGPQLTPTIEQVLEVNESVRTLLATVSDTQSVLRSKLQNALAAPVMKGPPGPIGPIGPANGLNAFGGVYGKGGVRTVAMTANVPTIVPMPFATPSKNMTFAGDGTIVIAAAGTYYAAFSAGPKFSANSNLTFALRVNGVAVDSAVNTFYVPQNATVWYLGNAIMDVPAGGVVDMAITSEVNQTMTFAEDDIENINIFRID